MINVHIISDWRDIRSVSDSQRVELLYDYSVESLFRLILERHEDAFKDDMSFKIMKDIDNAVRYGEYGIETPNGRSCITCLSTGCKFALILWDYSYNNIEVPIITDLWRCGENVWEFISHNFDISFYMYKDSVSAVDTQVLDASFNIHVDGAILSGDDKKTLLKVFLDIENEKYRITKQNESEAYDNFISENDRLLYRCLSEEISMKDYLQSVNGNCDKYGSYKVINYISEIPGTFSRRRLPIWIIADNMFNMNVSVKYPTFEELIVWDILDAAERKKTDTYFALVMDAEERSIIKEYPKNTVFGVLVELGKKQMTVYNKDMAVRKFHELYTQL